MSVRRDPKELAKARLRQSQQQGGSAAAGGAGAAAGQQATSFVLEFAKANSSALLQVASVLLALAFSGFIYKQGSASVQNLVNANAETLKSVLLGDKPFLFYCHKGGKQETPPQSFTQLNALKGSKLGFAMLNCSQIMPSGKSIAERFHVKKELRPAVFAAAPWLKMPKQIPPGHTKDLQMLKKYVESVLAPRATDVLNDKDLRNHCGFKNTTRDKHSIGDTCLVLVKGKRHSKQHTDLEEALIRAYPRVRTVALDGTKRRLSFEDVDAHPASDFALHVYALRNGTHSLTMIDKVTWDNLNTFVSRALGVMLLSYDGEWDEPITIVKTGAAASSFKDRTARQQQQQQQQQQQAPTSGSDSRRRKGSGSGGSGSGGSGSGSGSDSSEAPPPPEETAAERIAREARRREAMDRQARESLFEEDERDDRRADSSEDDEEELIEL